MSWAGGAARVVDLLVELASGGGDGGGGDGDEHLLAGSGQLRGYFGGLGRLGLLELGLQLDWQAALGLR